MAFGLLISGGSARADQYGDYAVQLYNQHKYEDARKYFSQSLKLSPNSDNSHYYRAMCSERLNDPAGASDDYQFVVSNSSNTKLVALARAGLQRTEANKAKAADTAKTAATSSAGSGSSSSRSSSAIISGVAVGTGTAGKGQNSGAGTSRRNSADEIDEMFGEHDKIHRHASDVVPDENRVYFTQSGYNDIYIETQVNGRDMNMILDTGAHSTMIGRNQLERIGLPRPSGPPTTAVGGIGAAQVPAWIMPLQIKLGKMVRTINVCVAESWDGHPLLGQDFYNDLEYEFDNKGHCIYFRKPKILSAAERSMYCIPFTRRGRHLQVDVEVDGGKRTGMLVDTGAEGIAMTMANLRDLGIDIPADAVRIRSQGVGGTSDGFQFPISMLRLGPIVQRNPTIQVSTAEEGMLGSKYGRYGLLGQAFFGNWRFTIDNANNMLRFFH
jgi:predicted aspartyl protease